MDELLDFKDYITLRNVSHLVQEEVEYIRVNTVWYHVAMLLGTLADVEAGITNPRRLEGY